MSNEKKEFGSPDQSRIDMLDYRSVGYWSKELGISAEHLREIVKMVGTSVEEARKQIQRRRQ
jgi:hypothetical protein